MADSSYPDDVQFAGLVQAATAAADAQTRDPSSLGKRKRDEGLLEHNPTLDEDEIDNAPDPAAGSHAPPLRQNSASILFREPSLKSKKHSRPPLGKVFLSLELAPENFLRLQAAAKAFMLDEAHPERRDAVGYKKYSGDFDIAKLNLWNCVEEFLLMHGYGEKFFAPGAGADIPGAPQRTLFWPQDSQTIIKLMMPLMRKMVTNERQRIYAATARKQGAAKETNKERLPTAADDSILSDGKAVDISYANQEIEAQPPAPVPVPVPVPVLVPAQQDQDEQSLSPAASQSAATFKQSVVLYVNVVSNTVGALRRVIPRFSLTPDAAPNLATLLSEVEKRYPLPPRSESTSGVEGRPVIKVWLPDGLVTVVEDGEWMVALLTAGVVDWMDGVRVLVEV